MEWSIRFDLGKVENSKYGTALNLKGELPLLSGGTNYKLPALAKDRTRLERIAQELLTKFPECFPGSSEAKARLQATFPVLYVSYQNPFLDYERDAALAAYVHLVLIGFAFDDVVDNVLKIEDGISNYKTFLAFTSYFGKSEFDCSKFIPTDSGNPESPFNFFRIMLANYSKAQYELTRLAWDPSTVEYFSEESHNYAMAAYFMFTSKSATPIIFSNTAHSRRIGQHVHAMRVMLEGSAVVNPGAKVPAKIRKTLPFQILKDSYGQATALINAIVGMRNDIRQETWEDTPLLRDVVEGKLTLQESFDNTVTTFKAVVRDMDLAIEILCQTYEGIEGVHKFLETTTHTFMGACLVLADETSRDRYPGTNFEIITMPKVIDRLTITPNKPTVCANALKLNGMNGMYFEFNPNDSAVDGELLIGCLPDTHKN